MDRPQHYAERTSYRPPARWYRRLNKLVGVGLVAAGLAPRDMVLLEVRGRASGRIRRTPMLRTRFDDADHLVALAGESHWVRNVRAAEGHAALRRRRIREVLLRELEPGDRTPVIAEYLRSAKRRSGEEAAAGQARSYFGLDPAPTSDDIASIVAYYPVFRVTYRS